MGAVLLLSGCTSLNAYLYPEGRSGNRDTLPVRVEELTEMAQYCKEAYDNKDESSGIRNNEFSYTVKQTDGITILIFRGTDVISSGGKNIGTDIDARLWKEDRLTKRWYGKQDAPKVLTAEDFKQKVTTSLNKSKIGESIPIDFPSGKSTRNINKLITYGLYNIDSTVRRSRPLQETQDSKSSQYRKD